MKLSGSIIQAYLICKRQAWFVSRQIEGDQYNEFLEIGRMLSEVTYRREKKEVITGRNKIDLIRNEDGVLTVVEVKKSSKRIKASKMQLLNYLYFLSEKGYKVCGEVRIPKEKKIIPVEFGDREKKAIEDLHTEINQLLTKEKPPAKKLLGVCKNCSYFEFCWS